MDPVTRIEGHMKVEIEVDTNGGLQQIVDARCTGTLFRGFETLLNGRSALDGPIITQRICGVCPISHGQAAVQALENVSNWLPPTNARLLRNLTLGANFLQSHILHFYLLAALDFVAGPAASPWQPAWQVDMRGGLESVGGNLPAAIAARRQAHEMGAVFGGKMPSSNTFIPGGFTTIPSTEDIDNYRQHLADLSQFIANIYLPDVQKVGEVYGDYFQIGSGSNNLMAYGAFEMDDTNSTRLFSGGYAENGDPNVREFATKDISESVKYSWYADKSENLNPSSGETVPEYPKGDAYSWMKAPRLNGQPFEAGPLARMWVNGDYQRGISVMDRHVARALESAKIAQAMTGWLDELTPGQNSYDDNFDQCSGFGVGLSEAPRGALGHWVDITPEGKISHYQVITPTCWNASPRDNQDVPGPLEQALIGTPIENPDQPVEALRVIHSYDPCLACAVHIMRPDQKPVIVHTGIG